MGGGQVCENLLKCFGNEPEYRFVKSNRFGFFNFGLLRFQFSYWTMPKQESVGSTIQTTSIATSNHTSCWGKPNHQNSIIPNQLIPLFYKSQIVHFNSRPSVLCKRNSHFLRHFFRFWAFSPCADFPCRSIYTFSSQRNWAP